MSVLNVARMNIDLDARTGIIYAMAERLMMSCRLKSACLETSRNLRHSVQTNVQLIVRNVTVVCGLVAGRKIIQFSCCVNCRQGSEWS